MKIVGKVFWKKVKFARNDLFEQFFEEKFQEKMSIEHYQPLPNRDSNDSEKVLRFGEVSRLAESFH